METVLAPVLLRFQIRGLIKLAIVDANLTKISVVRFGKSAHYSGQPHMEDSLYGWA